MKVTISEAALACGYQSRTMLYRLRRAGLLRPYEAGHRGRSLLLETHPVGRTPLREYVAGCVQLRYDSPLGQRGPTDRTSLHGLSDQQLNAYVEEVLSDDALNAAMAPITAWCDSQRAPDWGQIAEQFNAYLGDSWPAPPYSGGQTATLAMCLSLAEEAAGDD